jgi:UDP-GlcNAc:undecaprenyl-phosphate GlcNAc-1-phosphate transferase
MEWSPAATMLAPLGAAIGLSYFFNLAARHIAPQLGLVDQPDGGRKTHRQPTPVLGGVAFLAAILVVTAASFWLDAAWLKTDSVRRLAVSLSASAFGFGLLGVYDDRWPLSPRVKLIGQILASLPFVAMTRSLERIDVLDWEIPLGPLGAPVAVLWLVACANVVNLIDGLDGLAGSLGIVMMTTIAALFAMGGHAGEATLAVVIAGGLIGFLCHNWPPAKIFMGDAGSMTIGFLAGALSIQAASKTATTFTLAVPFVLMSIPLFDTSMAIVRRKLTGRKIGEGDRGHIHHRLQDRGLTRQQALLAISGLTLVMAGAVLISVVIDSEVSAVGICGGVLGLLILGRVFGYHETSLLFQYLKQLGDVLVETSGVLQTRWMMARFEHLEPHQPSQLWDQLIEQAAKLKTHRLEYQCRSAGDDRIATQLRWDNPDAEVIDDVPMWRVSYRVPRDQRLVATLEVQGQADTSEILPRVDDLLFLFTKICRNLPAAEDAAIHEQPAVLRFPAPQLAEPAQHAA